MALPVRASVNPVENAPAWVAVVTALVTTWLTDYLDADYAYAVAGALGLILGVLAQRFTFPWSDLLDHGDEPPPAVDPPIEEAPA